MFIAIDLLTTLGIIALIMEMTMADRIPSWLAAWALVIFVGFRAFARATGGVGRSVYWFFAAIFYGVLLIFLVFSGGWEHVAPLLTHMFFGGFEAMITHIGVLFIKGYVSISYLAVFILLIFMARWLGRETGNLFLHWSLFSLAAPVFVFLTMLSMAKIEDWRGVIQIGGGILALLIILEIFYIIVYWLFSRKGEISNA
jgi:hypothetical protein